MVTDGDCWPRPSLPIVQQLSQDSVMDSGATPFMILEDGLPSTGSLYWIQPFSPCHVSTALPEFARHCLGGLQV